MNMKKLRKYLVLLVVAICATSCNSCSSESSYETSGYNVSFKSGRVDCPECVDGKCKHCGGDDIMVVYSTLIDCPHCWGGKCHRCNGRGWYLE